MIKNIKLKKLLKATIYKPLTLLNKFIPKNDKIVLLYIADSEIKFNLKPLLDYLIENNYNKKYTILCGIESKVLPRKKIYNVKYISKLSSQFLFLISKHVFYTAGQIPIKPGKNQIVIHLTHGAIYYKTMGAMTNINNGDEFYFNKMITTCEFFKPIIKKSYKCKDDNILICNEPITDIFYRSDSKSNRIKGYKKILLWLPTFRQSDLLGYNNSSTNEALLIFKEEQYEELNNYLREKSILLIVKLHDAQNVDNIASSQYSNLKIYTGKQFEEHGYYLYSLMQCVDGLIGDYSSASLQFLLLDRPMAFVVPDIDEYKQQRGFVFKDPIKFMPGNIIKTTDEFYTFIDQINGEKDPYKTQRKKVRDKLYKYQDGNACKRVLEDSNIKL